MPHKVNHILRGRNPDDVRSIIRVNDRLLIAALRDTIGLKQEAYIDTLGSRMTIIQARRGAGGLGIPTARDTAFGAYIGSRQLTVELVSTALQGHTPVPPALPDNCNGFLRQWRAETGCDFQFDPAQQQTGIQKAINRSASNFRMQRLQSTATGRLRAHIESNIADPWGTSGFLDDIHAGARLNRPNLHCGNDPHLPFRVSVARYIGIPVVLPGGARCLADDCGTALDSHGDHAACCRKGSCRLWLCLTLCHGLVEDPTP